MRLWVGVHDGNVVAAMTIGAYSGEWMVIVASRTALIAKSSRYPPQVPCIDMLAKYKSNVEVEWRGGIGQQVIPLWEEELPVVGHVSCRQGAQLFV